MPRDYGHRRCEAVTDLWSCAVRPYTRDMAALLSNNHNTDAAGPRSPLERWLALLVRYWAFNMSLIHSRGGNWPGFGYTGEEKVKLQSIAAKVPFLEYAAWLAFVVVIYLGLLIVIVMAGMSVLIHT